MTDHWLHHRLFSQPKRSRQTLNARIMRLVNELPNDKSLAPELVRELLEMDVPFPIKAKRQQIGEGATIIQLEPVDEPTKWQRFVDAWIGK